ncbi:DUF4389 domain-containing protein [Gilvimarinus agarilyticus]|uniref:DUF4389 domain-containing protein n=1 Tax=Gilvimarinus agarilyticus TaxID=679259 RepID=UPI000696430E|nr:DUF4389 domain-containing protein [Gilvimarinus agarilyticus]
MDNEKIKSNITSSDHWIRLVFMILFALVLYVAGIVVGVLVLVQFLFALITGSDNTNLRQLGDSLTQYIAQTLRFLTYNSSEKPFPFADWPEPAPVAEVVEPEEVVTTSTADTASPTVEVSGAGDAQDENSSKPV